MSTNPNTEDSASGLTTETGEASNLSAKDTSSRNNGRSPAPPQLAGGSARDRLASGTSGSSDRTGTSGTTDSEDRGTTVTTTDADGEIEGIFEKEYEEGDCGKVEALHDLQEVFNELEGENLIGGFDVYTSYNVQPPKPPKPRATSSSKKSRVNSARAREELTPGPRIGLALKNKKPMDLTKAFNSMNQTSIHSLPELEKKGPQLEALMRYEPTASLPLLGNKVDPLKRNPQGKKSKFVNPSELPPIQKQRIPLRSSRASPQISSASSSSRPPTQLMTAEEFELAAAHQKVRENLDFLPETSEGDEEGTADEAGVLYRRLSSAESSFSERSCSSRGVTGIRTPTLPQKRETPKSKKPVESWKSDLAKVTRVKSIHKPPLHMPGPEGSTLQLKYKPPIWPHQKSLIQILDRMPLLTCLVLDGSEINFLRDLGSHLPSLQTLSVAKCGLRSLDGTFAFPNLRTLIASGNNITLPVQASYLQQLCHLDLSFNPLKTMENFQQLVMCPTLVSLNLVGCSISQHPDFYTKMKKLLPQVKELRPEFYTPAPWNYNTAEAEAQRKKEVKAEELDPSQMMRLHDYIDREIQMSTSHRESLILKTEPLFTTSQFVAKFQKNFEKFRLNLERSRESMELGYSESDSYISDVTTEYTTTNEEAGGVGRKSSLPFTGILGSISELTTTATTTADMTPPRVTTLSETTTTTTAPKTGDKNRSQGASLLEKGYNNDDDGGELGGAGYSSEVEDFWDAQETQEDLLPHEDTSDEKEDEFEEATTDAGDFGVVSDEQDMYLRRYEHTDDIEEGDGDHV